MLVLTKYDIRAHFNTSMKITIHSSIILGMEFLDEIFVHILDVDRLPPSAGGFPRSFQPAGTRDPGNWQQEDGSRDCFRGRNQI